QEGSQAGYMRLGGQFGFAFLSPPLSQGEGFERTIAHELGHGVFKLDTLSKKTNPKKAALKP
ncbi:MAG: hypothetical protein Q4C98_10405, partial [Capnocytophaga sp.]|nr:hypothetical protein [Capnocytophaga sp.]